MLQLHAMFIARPSWQGLLQDYASNARSFRAAVVGKRCFHLDRRISNAARV
jgi:hypothetical protein